MSPSQPDRTRDLITKEDQEGLADTFLDSTDTWRSYADGSDPAINIRLSMLIALSDIAMHYDAAAILSLNGHPAGSVIREQTLERSHDDMLTIMSIIEHFMLGDMIAGKRAKGGK